MGIYFGHWNAVGARALHSCSDPPDRRAFLVVWPQCIDAYTWVIYPYVLVGLSKGCGMFTPSSSPHLPSNHSSSDSCVQRKNERAQRCMPHVPLSFVRSSNTSLAAHPPAPIHCLLLTNHAVSICLSRPYFIASDTSNAHHHFGQDCTLRLQEHA